MDISSLYSNMNIQQLNGKNDPKALEKVAKEMEANFAYQLIKTMRESTEMFSKESLGGNTFMSMFDLELSGVIAERGLGLKDMLLKQLNQMANGDVSQSNNKGAGVKGQKVSNAGTPIPKVNNK